MEEKLNPTVKDLIGISEKEWETAKDLAYNQDNYGQLKKYITNIVNEKLKEEITNNFPKTYDIEEEYKQVIQDIRNYVVDLRNADSTQTRNEADKIDDYLEDIEREDKQFTNDYDNSKIIKNVLLEVVHDCYVEHGIGYPLDKYKEEQEEIVHTQGIEQDH